MPAKPTELWPAAIDRSQLCLGLARAARRYSTIAFSTLVGIQAKDVAGKSIGLVGRDDKVRHVRMVGLRKHL
jgi:hypothetical protein